MHERIEHIKGYFSKPYNSQWLTAILSLMLVLLTYPAFEPEHGVGLDPSYVWGFNYLFDYDYASLTELTYPYGPLALLRIPVAVNGHYALFLVFFTLLKFCLVWQTLRLAQRRSLPLLATVVAMVPFAIVANIDLLVFFNVALLTLYAIEFKSVWRFLLATLLAIFGYSIKVSIGLQSCMVVFVGWTLILILYKDLRFSLVTAGAVPVLLLLVGLAVWHSLPRMFDAYVGMTHLFGGYSEALVLPNGHKMWKMIVCICFVVAFLLSINGRWGKIMCLLLILPLFANWKYGIVREDFYHLKQLLYFSVCFVSTILLAQERINWPSWLCSAAAIGMLYVAVSDINYNSSKILTASPHNFFDKVIGYKKTVDKSQSYIANALNTRKLPPNVVETIGSGTTDCYPWEQVFIGANSLRWQPHCTVELGAGNTLWLNHKAALNFNSSHEAVQYIIFHKPNYDNDLGLISIDGRYLLNDEPAILDSILSNYSVADSGQWYGMLLHHGGSHYNLIDDTIASMSVGFGEWIPVPTHRDGILKASVGIKHNFAGFVKKTLYKPDIYYVDYLMPDSTVHTYRFSRETASSGLWVSPYVNSYSELASLFCGNTDLPNPQSIRIRSDGNTRTNTPHISVTFRCSHTPRATIQ